MRKQSWHLQEWEISGTSLCVPFPDESKLAVLYKGRYRQQIMHLTHMVLSWYPNQEGERQLWSSSLSARRDRDISVTDGVVG